MGAGGFLGDGIPGLIALGAVNAAGLALALVAHYGELFAGQRLGSPQRTLQTYLLVIALTAVYFWVWALLNTLRTSFDMGVVSFAVPLFTCSYILVFDPDSSLQIGSLRLQRCMTGFACLCPAANYIAAAILVHKRPQSLILYLGVAGGWWVAAALLGPLLVQRQITWLAQSVGRGEHDMYNAP